MNFLSHYYFYKSGDPYYDTGLVLPDLVKAFCRMHLKPAETYNRPLFNQLAAGSHMHLHSDKLFHNSSFFSETNQFISRVWDHTCHWPRKWFLNHLVCEILTDRVLMDRFPGLCKEFYTQLENTDPEQISLFLKISGILNYQNFSEAFIRFQKIAFIFEYQHNENIINALSRLYSRSGIVYEWTDFDRKLLLENIPEIITYIHNEVDKLESELK